jgi:hypothetical protein
VVLACASLVAAQGSANLILYKKVHTENNYLAVGQNATIELIVYNVGKGVATEISLRDNWNADNYTVVAGEIEAEYESLAPGEKISHNITLVPQGAGTQPGFRASVEYKRVEGGDTVTGYSTPMYVYHILTPEQYARFTATKYLEWGIFVGGLAASIVVPYFLYSTGKAAAKKSD